MTSPPHEEPQSHDVPQPDETAQRNRVPEPHQSPELHGVPEPQQVQRPVTTQVTCPTCGTVSHLEELARDADAFCRTCDFPLFWARTERVLGASGESGAGLRRLPGTAGRVDVATIDCPECREPNPVARTICIRCGSLLRPVAPVVVVAPPPPPPPPPPPEPEPEVVPARSLAWLWVLLVAAGVAVALLVVLLTTT